MKTILLSLSLAFVAIGAKAQNVDIPDANFKAALIATNTIDLNKDGIIQTSEALLVTSLNVENKSITSLAGIEAFTALRILKCDHNAITTLDVSKNIILDSLWCNDNALISLNVSGAVVLRYLSCNNNPKLTRVCVNITQLASLSLNWIKDLTAIWVTDCTAGIPDIINDNNNPSKTLLHVYNNLGQEVSKNEINQGGIFIYKYSDGSFKRIAKF